MKTTMGRPFDPRLFALAAVELALGCAGIVGVEDVVLNETLGAPVFLDPDTFPNRQPVGACKCRREMRVSCSR